jgi:hypothetical protein
MTKFLASLCLLAAVGFTSKAQALDATTCINKTGCASAVTVDSGTATRCGGNGLLGMRNCECGWQSGACGANYYLVNSGTACPSLYYYVGMTVAGKKCCQENYSCQAQCTCAPAAPMESEKIETTTNGDLASTFAPETTLAVYYGYYGTTSRSPSAGRQIAADAKLDVCLGDADADLAKQYGLSWCQTYGCGATRNEYCQASSAAVCLDRCECSILTPGDPACNNL